MKTISPRLPLLLLLLTLAAFSSPNDPYFRGGAQWYLNSISAPTAWNITEGSEDVIVAILDTGINAQHPDLVGKVLPGYNFVNDSNDTSDTNGHGTAVAGCVTAHSNNNLGIAGLASKVKLLPVKIIGNWGNNNWGANNNDLIAGIRYAADNGADVINLSIALLNDSALVAETLDYAWSKGCVIVAGAGNDGSDTPVYTATHPKTIAVSATTYNDTIATYSNYGSHIDVCAPGSGIMTLRSNGGYGGRTGTSFAAPLVSGVAALLASLPNNFSNQQIVDIIKMTADDLGNPNQYGSGKVNAAAAVSAATFIMAPVQSDPVPDTAPISTLEPVVSIIEISEAGIMLEALVDNGVDFSIECSADMKNWDALYNGTGTGSTENYEVLDFSDECGFLRISTK